MVIALVLRRTTKSTCCRPKGIKRISFKSNKENCAYDEQQQQQMALTMCHINVQTAESV